MYIKREGNLRVSLLDTIFHLISMHQWKVRSKFIYKSFSVDQAKILMSYESYHFYFFVKF